MNTSFTIVPGVKIADTFHYPESFTIRWNDAITTEYLYNLLNYLPKRPQWILYFTIAGKTSVPLVYYLFREFSTLHTEQNLLIRISNNGAGKCYKSGAAGHSCGTDCGEGGQRRMAMDPACKVALITGGDSGIGFAMASQLLKAGAKNVAITGTDACRGREAVHKLNSAFGKSKAMFIGANVTCMVQFEETFKTVKEAFKNIDIVVNSAGVLDGKNWEREIVVNLVGTIRGTLLAHQYVGKEGSGKGGVVVNLCGIQALHPHYTTPTFTATQSGILGLTRSFGHHFHDNKSGVRVVQLVTGFTQTDFIKGLERKGMTPQLSHELTQVVAKAKKQNAEACGQALIHLIRCAPTGSVWVIEGSRLFEVEIPDWNSYSTLTAQYI